VRQRRPEQIFQLGHAAFYGTCLRRRFLVSSCGFSSGLRTFPGFTVGFGLLGGLVASALIGTWCRSPIR
jgi:hypothetical protein